MLVLVAICNLNAHIHHKTVILTDMQIHMPGRREGGGGQVGNLLMSSIQGSRLSKY